MKSKKDSSELTQRNSTKKKSINTSEKLPNLLVINENKKSDQEYWSDFSSWHFVVKIYIIFCNTKIT